MKKLGLILLTLFVVWVISTFLIYSEISLKTIGLTLIVIAILLKFLPKLISRFYVIIPEVKGGVVISKISGRTGKILKEGVHFILPWWYIKIIPLEKSVPKEIIIDSIPTKDGGTVSFKCSYQYRPCINHLNKYIENDESIIRTGIEDMIKSFIGQFATIHTTEEIIKSWGELENFVYGKFKESHECFDEYLNKKVKYTDLEDKYGVEIIRLSLTDIDLPPEIQAQREKVLKERYNETGEKKLWENTLKRMKQIKNKFNLPDKDALNAIQVERDKIQKQVIEIEGLNEITKTITQSIIEAFKGGQK